MALALSNKTVAGSATAGGYDIDVGSLLAGNTVNLTYKDTPAGTSHKVTIMQVSDPAALPLSNTATDDPNDTVIGVDFSAGLPAVISQLNSKFNGRIQFSTTGGTMLRIVDDGAAGTTDVSSVTATQTVTSLSGGSGELPFFTDTINPYSGAITSLGSQSAGFAGRITVNAQLLADPSKLVVYQAGVQAGDSTRPNFLNDRLTDTAMSFSPNTGIGTATAPYSGTLQNFLRQFLSQQGENASNASNLAEGQGVVVNALKQRVADTSSVNIDDEMSHLLQLQTAYGANARVMTTLKDMLDTLMRM
jgi:flagellar hook-associated protein 1 FlgK